MLSVTMPAPAGLAVSLRYWSLRLPPGRRDAEQAEELRVGPHGDQVPAGVDPAGQVRHLPGRERRLAEHDDVVVREQRRVERRDVRRRIRVQALGLKNLGQVAA